MPARDAKSVSEAIAAFSGQGVVFDGVIDFWVLYLQDFECD